MLRVDDRTHADDLCQIYALRAGTGPNAQREISAEREPDQAQFPARAFALQGTHCANELSQAARVKQTDVEVVRVSVVAQIEPDDLEAPSEQILSKRHDVRRI